MEMIFITLVLTTMLNQPAIHTPLEPYQFDVISEEDRRIEYEWSTCRGFAQSDLTDIFNNYALCVDHEECHPTDVLDDVPKMVCNLVLVNGEPPETYGYYRAATEEEFIRYYPQYEWYLYEEAQIKYPPRVHE